MNSKGWMKRGLIAAVAMSFSVSAMAQNNTGGAGQTQQVQPGYNGGRAAQQAQQGQQGGFDPSQIRTRMNDQIKEALSATDDEWAILSPRIEKVQSIQADLGQGTLGAIGLFARGAFGRGGGMGGGGQGGRQGGFQGQGGQGGFQGQGGNRGGFDISSILGPETPIRRKMAALQQALDNQSMPDAEIKTLLASIRADRVKLRADLAAAQGELIQFLTQRQEAILFQRGILD